MGDQRRASRVSSQRFTLRDQKAVVRYLFVQDIDGSEIHKLLQAACGPGAPSYKECRQWIQDISDGNEEQDMCVCAGGRKKTLGGSGINPADDPALVIRIENLVLGDSRISIDQMKDFTGAEYSDINEILTSTCNVKKISERWVQRLWTPEQRTFRIDICKHLMDLCESEGGSDFMNRIIVADDTFVLYHNRENGGGPTAVTRKKETAGKYKSGEDPTAVYCCFFFDIKGPIAYDMLPSTTIPTSEEYIHTLKEVLVPAIIRKRPGTFMIPDKPYLLLHSQSHAHTTPDVAHALRGMNIQALPHAALSPDLEPYEYWLYKALKRSLGQLTFKSRTDLWSALNRQMHSLTEQEFGNSISRLRDRWNFCVEKDGLYLL